ncbi:MAG: UvrD-helicase domain-containing protein [Pirellulaceae bacterium]|nr:UvrD-helicase domain-containing protein [Planctomycetales bacterium]
MQRDYVNELTEAQQAAVTHVVGPLLILAGPGSGKTRVVTYRIAHLLSEGIPSDQILALTFTNKAADEMRQRLRGMIPDAGVWIGTFHRFCSRLLRSYAPMVGLAENFTIYDTDDSLSVLRDVISDTDDLPETHPPARILQAISGAKSRLIGPDDYEPQRLSTLGAAVKRFYPAYQRRLLESNALDFDDLLMHTAHLMRDNPETRAELDDRYRFVLVDEYQDTNMAQYMIVRALSVNHPNLAVTGDPDQAIYGWRGADISNILEFERDYPQAMVVRLEQNYRSTPQILQVADALISHNVRRRAKSIFTELPGGQPVRIVRYPHEQAESDAIASRILHAIENEAREPRDFAILYRTNALSRHFEHALQAQGLAYQIVNGVEFYQRQEIKDLLAYLRLVNNPRDVIAFKRIVNRPARGIGKKTVERLLAYANEHGVSPLEAARKGAVIAGISQRFALALLRFANQIDEITAASGMSVEACVGLVLSVTDYDRVYRESEEPEDSERYANIQELLSAARQFDDTHPYDGGLEAFLEQASLVNDTDDWENDDNKVTLMTMHAAKGLEFPVVFVVAVEHSILPHERAKDDPVALEEERRLLFVGITRAQHALELSYTTRRNYRGKQRYSIPSSFLMELPRGDMVTEVDTMDDGFADHWTAHAEFAHAMTEDGFVHVSFADEEERDESAEMKKNMVDQSARSCSRPSLAVPSMMTAAELLGASSPPERVDPDSFSLGDMVRDSKAGIGRIIALSGSGTKRTATVQFLTNNLRQTFVLQYSSLQLLASSSD